MDERRRSHDRSWRQDRFIAKAAGYNDLGEKHRCSRDAIFRIALTNKKAVTSVAIMMRLKGSCCYSILFPDNIPPFKQQTVLDKFNAVDTTYTTTLATREITIKDSSYSYSGIGYAQIGSWGSKCHLCKKQDYFAAGVTDETLLQAMTRLGGPSLAPVLRQKFTAA